MSWKILSKKTAFANRWRTIEEWKMQTHTNDVYDFYITQEQDVIMVAGLTSDKKVLIIRQYYFAHQQKFPTFVAGIVDADESPLAAAERELKEETGCVAKEFVYLGKAVKGKYATSHFHFYLALDVEQTLKQELEAVEDIEVEFINYEGFKKMVEAQEFPDAFAELLAYRLFNYLENSKNI
jgi:8-oxo-dGTP pyrophosphatase MutT (NUDIX family)